MADALGANVKTLSELLGLFSKTFTGSKVEEETSGGSQTQQTMLSPETVSGLLKQLMEGTSGLAAVASGQKGAGMYNTTSRTLLMNDLLSRNATNVAEKAAPVVTTKNPSKVTRITPPTMSKGVGLTGLALAAAASPSARKKIGDLLGGIGGGATGAGDGPGFSIEGVLGSPGDWGLDSSAGGAIDNFSSTFDTTGIEGLVGSFLGEGDGAGFAIEGLLGGGADWGLDAASSFLGDGAGFATEGVLGSAADWGLDAAAGIGVPWYSIANIGFDALGYEGGAMQAVGDVVDIAGDAVGDVLDAVTGDTVICTYMHSLGKMDDATYAADRKFGAALPMETRIGYHFWATPLVAAMKVSPTLTYLVSLLAIPWAKHMHHLMDSSKEDSLVGKILMAIGKPVCTAIGTYLIASKKRELAHGN